MTERLAVLLFTTVVTLLLGLAVWLKNSSLRVNQYYAAFSFCVAAWTLSNALVVQYAHTPYGILWARSAFVSASLIPLAFFLFASVFPVRSPAPSVILTGVLSLAATVAALLSTTPLVARTASSRDGVLHMTYGPMHPFFAIYVLSVLGYGLFLLYRKLRILTGIQRLQVRYVLLAVALPLFGATVTNLLIPLAFGSSRFSVYGPLFSIPMVAVIAHAIIRHRLMNTRLVIRRGAAYILTIVAAALAFIFFLSLASQFIAAPQELPLSVELLALVLIAMAFHPFERALRRWLDTYLFRQPYHYDQTIREISRAMSALLDVEPLLKYVCDTVTRTVQPEHVAIYMRDEAGLLYRRLVSSASLPSDVNVLPREIDAASPLVRHLSHDRRPLLLDEPHIRPPLSPSLIEQCHLLRAELLLPILHDDSLSGFLVLASKLSGDPYFTEDLDLLATLVSQASVALKNAQLYSQVVFVNEYVENILTTIESAVIATTSQGIITLFNPGAERLTGLSAHAVRFRALHVLPPMIGELLQATLRDQHPRTQVEMTLHPVAGPSVSVICSTAPLRNLTGALLGCVAVLSDLTRLKTLEDEKRQAERLASIGALASGIAHEIKNPLVAIKTFAELLPERFAEEDFRNDFARVVVTEIERIDDLVARLRGLATPAARQPQLVDLTGPIEETLALLRGQIEHARIRARVDIASDLPYVAGDPAQLKQLFLNVLMNALEALPPGGDILVKAEARDMVGYKTVVVSVTDSGPGIPESLLGRIFDPFVTTKERGSGLGLSICRGITDAHRATIKAENNPTGGATVTIEFPVADPLSAPIQERR